MPDAHSFSHHFHDNNNLYEDNSKMENVNLRNMQQQQIFQIFIRCRGEYKSICNNSHLKQHHVINVNYRIRSGRCSIALTTFRAFYVCFFRGLITDD